MYTIAEVAIILSTETELVHKWIDDGLLPALHLGDGKSFLRVRMVDLENFIDEHLRTGKIKLPKK